MLQVVAPLMIVIYNRNMFIVQATDLFFDKNNFISLTCVLEGELSCAPCPLNVKAKPTNSLWRKVMESTLNMKKNSKA